MKTDSIGKGKQSATAVQFAEKCVLTFVKLVEVGGDATLTLYDSATATTAGKTIRDYLEAEDGDSQVGGPRTNPITFHEGVYAVLTGQSSYYFIEVEPR